MYKTFKGRWGLGFVCAKISAKLRCAGVERHAEDSNLPDHVEETALGVREQSQHLPSSYPGSVELLQ